MAAEIPTPSDPAAPDAGTRPKVLEAADCSFGGPEGADFALTCEWPDGTETLEYVSHHAARLLGYDPDDEGNQKGDAPSEQHRTMLLDLFAEWDRVGTCNSAWDYPAKRLPDNIVNAASDALVADGLVVANWRHQPDGMLYLTEAGRAANARAIATAPAPFSSEGEASDG